MEPNRGLIEALCDLHRCPNSGKVVESPKHDDKVFCGCGKPMRLPNGQLEGQPGLHIKRFMAIATVDEYLAQEHARRTP